MRQELWLMFIVDYVEMSLKWRKTMREMKLVQKTEYVQNGEQKAPKTI